MHRTLDQNAFPASHLPPIVIGKRDIPTSQPKALIFDLMGTCCDWFSSIIAALEASPPLPNIPKSSLPQFAIDWREGFFKEVHYRFSTGQKAEDIDMIHRYVLDQLLEEREVDLALWNEEVRNRLVDHWHRQTGSVVHFIWPGPGS